MGIHGNKSQQERDWVLSGKLECFDVLFVLVFLVTEICG